LNATKAFVAYLCEFAFKKNCIDTEGFTQFIRYSYLMQSIRFIRYTYFYINWYKYLYVYWYIVAKHSNA